ncbi:type II toxin-antitoxin system PemK/MazF family toxin [Pleomorphovibrio marinus]|uniref:type II toxin-antitoxin system PemK/MazF family toxin n=1 Tax=Pleomorphovibrio marinus TaxID=2164132 RepID=UPI000E09F0E8|nr:type II toxin-antitoxin system PemK/MazF family toxin [Pleomorphovibrio marinus]
MKQGEIWHADLNPSKGSEQAGFRPVVILSGNLVNQHLPVVICAPLTSKIKNYKGNPVLQPNASNGLTKDSEILIFHIRSISKVRLIRKIGDVSPENLSTALQTLNDLMTL